MRSIFQTKVGRIAASSLVVLPLVFGSACQSREGGIPDFASQEYLDAQGGAYERGRQHALKFNRLPSAPLSVYALQQEMLDTRAGITTNVFRQWATEKVDEMAEVQGKTRAYLLGETQALIDGALEGLRENMINNPEDRFAAERYRRAEADIEAARDAVVEQFKDYQRRNPSSGRGIIHHDPVYGHGWGWPGND